MLFLEDFLQREPTSQYDPTGGNTQPEVTLDLVNWYYLKPPMQGGLDFLAI